MRQNSDNSITATFGLPGLLREDVEEVELHNNILTISGERSSCTETRPSGQIEER